MSRAPRKPAVEREIWTVQDVAEYLQLCEATVKANAAKQNIPGVKVGAVWRFHRDVVRSFARGEWHKNSEGGEGPDE